MKIPRPMTDAELEKFARFYGHGAVPEIIVELLDARAKLRRLEPTKPILHPDGYPVEEMGD